MVVSFIGGGNRSTWRKPPTWVVASHGLHFFSIYMYIQMYVYENQRLPRKWHSLPGLQMVSNSPIYSSFEWIKKGSFLLNLQPKNEFQTTTKYERHDIGNEILLKYCTCQSTNQSNNTTYYVWSKLFEQIFITANVIIKWGSCLSKYQFQSLLRVRYC